MKTHRSLSPDSAAQRHFALNRRQFLRGVGACMALPVFESALSPMLRAAPVRAAAGESLAVTATGAPLRMGFVYIPNGTHQENWWPTEEGTGYTLSKTLEPLAPPRSGGSLIAREAEIYRLALGERDSWDFW